MRFLLPWICTTMWYILEQTEDRVIPGKATKVECREKKIVQPREVSLRDVNMS